MKKTIRAYRNDFIKILDSVAVTDIRGKKLDFIRGIEMACAAIRKQSKKGGKVFFIGNGGSAAIANHMAIDFWKNAEIASMSFGESSLLTCVSNDFGYEEVFSKPIKFFANEKDILFAISSSGQSKNILKAVQAAKSKGAGVITLSGFASKNPLRAQGKYNFYAPSREYGPVEIVHQYICHCIVDVLIKHK